MERGWVWQIPVTPETTSVGVVVEKDVFRASRLDIEGFFNSHIQTNPDLTRAMLNAQRLNEFKSEGDYSYSVEKLVGDGYVLIGDAARFVDPIFSSGVSIAVYSAKFASEKIKHAFDTNDFSEAVFRPYEVKLRGGVSIWYEFIRLYYKLLPLFTYFVQNKKYRLQILRLLQGEVFDRDTVPVLDSMREFIEMADKSSGHLFYDKLADFPIEKVDEIPGDA